MKSRKSLWLFLSLLLAISLACAGGVNFEGLVNEAGEAIEIAIKTAIEEAMDEYGIDIPTDKVREVEFSNGDLTMLVEAEYDTIVLMMQANALQSGYSEQEGNTVITDDSVTMVYDGHESGLATEIIITDEGDGLIRISISLQTQ